ncbi:MAG: V-type ATPase 116kDa subunit family protein [Planctomycetaceae bacterium]
MRGKSRSQLDRLQKLGCIHLLDLSGRRKSSSPPHDISTETLRAVRYLQTCHEHHRQATDESDFDFEGIVHQALKLERHEQELNEERDELLLAVKNLQPWGDFRLPNNGELRSLKLWFYILPHHRRAELTSRKEAWQVVSRDNRFDYVAVVNESEPADMPVPRVRLDDRPLSELRQRLKSVDAELEELHFRRVSLTRWNALLSRAIAIAEDRAELRHAAERAWDDPSLFVVQGWVPQPRLDELQAFCRDEAMSLTVEAPADDDHPPTLLHNSGVTEGGEQAVTFYTTPDYRDWDPSSIVFVSFSLFFAMIMADAGYAALLAVVLLLVWKRLGRMDGGRRLRKLVLAVVGASVAYGVAVGSYFGVTPSDASFAGTLHVIDATDTRLMMLISVAVGVIHLVIANLVLAWHRRHSLRMIGSLGWVAVLAGGLAFGFGRAGIEPQNALSIFGGWAIAVGGVAVLLFSSQRPFAGAKLKDHGLRLVDGILSLTSISKAFGDVLSYLRLFALGLASAQLAITFNDLSHQASGTAGVGSLLALLVLLIGHSLNFVLIVMSGVVHGLRLNCIEFFGWGLEGEGFPFRPFRKRVK